MCVYGNSPLAGSLPVLYVRMLFFFFFQLQQASKQTFEQFVEKKGRKKTGKELYAQRKRNAKNSDFSWINERV